MQGYKIYNIYLDTQITSIEGNERADLAIKEASHTTFSF